MANDLFAPPTDQELYAPPPSAPSAPTQGSVGTGGDSLFAPPTDSELYAPPPATGGEQSSVDRELQNRSIWDRPALRAQPTTPEEIESIARKHGVDPEDLKSLAPYFGARDASGNTLPLAKEAAGYASSAVGLNVPQKLYKMSQSPEMEKALDEVQELAAGRTSYAGKAGEFLAPLPGAAAGTLGKAVLHGAAIGAAAGFGGSSQGEALKGTAVGAGLGAALGGAVHGLISKLSGPTEARLGTKVAVEQGAEIDKGAKDILATRSKSEGIIADHLAGDLHPDDITPEMADTIVSEQIDPDSMQNFLNPGTEEGALMRQRLAKEAPDDVAELGEARATQKLMAQDIIENRAKDFAEDLTKSRPSDFEEAQEAIAKYADRQGEEATANKYKQFVDEIAGNKYIDDNAIRAGREGVFTTRASNFMTDAQFVMRDIDDRFGTNTEMAHKDLNAATNRMSFIRQNFSKDLDNIYRAAPKEVDAAVTDGTDLYRALDTGDFSGLTPAEAQTAQGFKDYFRKGLEFVNDKVREKDPDIAPMNIPARENYVPHLMPPADELVSRFQNKVSEATKAATETLGRPIDDLSQISGRELTELAQSEGPVKDLVEGMQVLDNRPLASGADLSARIKDTFNTRDGRTRLGTLAKSALERQGVIPDWMRETNLYKLADRWTNNTLKHLYLRQPMDRLASASRLIDRAGGTVESKYVNNLLEDIGGVRAGTAAEQTLQTKIKYQRYIDSLLAKNDNPVTRGVAAVAKAVPEIMSDFSRQMYANVLGLSPRATLRHLTEVWLHMAPDLGTQYGYTAVFKGATKFVLNPAEQLAKVEELGFHPAQYVQKYRRAVADGIRRSSTYAIPSQTIDAMGDAAMWLFTKADKINRAIAISTAEAMASDLARGSNLAAQSLSKLPATVQRAVGSAAGEQEVANIIASHLNASTLFNYNRASMSEYGRTMGPLFSAFSKWPTAIAGEIAYEFRNKGAMKGAQRLVEKFGVPLALAAAVDKTVLHAGDPDSSDRMNKLFTKGGFASSAPIGAWKEFLEGKIFTPPAIEALIHGVVIPAWHRDPGKIKHGMIDAMQTFTPGSVYVRFLTDDLVTMISGQRPEGSNFVERTEAGAKKLDRMVNGK